MAKYFVRATGGSNLNSGLSYALAFATLSKAATTVAPGDTVVAAPGSYRELLTISTSGDSLYSTGTVSLTNGSAVVTGSGTSFLANVFNSLSNGNFQSSILASGSDGVTNGTATFTSAAGNFQASMIGLTIQIGTKSAYIISAVASATSITLKNPDGSAPAPTAGTGLAYSVMSGQGPISIASVDSNTQLTLDSAWAGPTVTGVAYIAYRGILWQADYLGTQTDGVGGVVRITGSDNDQTATRATCITTTSKNYNLFSGFALDTTTGTSITLTSCQCFTFRKMNVTPSVFQGLNSGGAGQLNLTIDGCWFGSARNGGIPISITHSSSIDNCGYVIQNSIIYSASQGTALGLVRMGGTTVKNCVFLNGDTGIATNTLNAGQAVTVNNCIFQNLATALSGGAVGFLIEDFNTIFATTTPRSNATAGVNSNLYSPLFDVRWFFQEAFQGAGPNNPSQVITPFDLASYSQLVGLAGIFPTATDVRGTGAIGGVRERGTNEYDSTLKIKAGGGGGSVFGGLGGVVL